MHNLTDEKGQPLWSQFNRGTQTALINFAGSGKGTDIAAIICHEVSHSLLDPNKFEEKMQESVIYGVQHSYMKAIILAFLVVLISLKRRKVNLKLKL